MYSSLKEGFLLVVAPSVRPDPQRRMRHGTDVAGEDDTFLAARAAVASWCLAVDGQEFLEHEASRMDTRWHHHKVRRRVTQVKKKRSRRK